ncbi:me53 [Choristoneura fumiferana multiple nucleopolyhedrovirus]|uniref:Me53 n=1 Tax=Choristoneura fumiferana nuclear polyhedrosis virus TaxID=208973 RepID=Q7TLM9_NPVCF|nr:me53 [Choristoneura fumiferana multiple nucleopolyhedrovirus]AAP29907.1 me53 [Choristoneura fumiferana multiple nucleopolyhedrovirus]
MKWFRENNIFDKRSSRTAAADKPAVATQGPASPAARRVKPLNKSEQAHAAIIKRIGRGSDKLNDISASLVPPEYGFRFDNVPACSHKLEYACERDLREHFLSDNEREAMKSLLRFATNYVLGYVNSKDMLTFGRAANLKTKDGLEHVQESECTMCGYKFKENTRVWMLYVIVRHPPRSLSASEEPAAPPSPDAPGHFEFACCECADNYHDQLNSHQVYPGISSVHAQRLFKSGFFYQYVFPLEFRLEHFTFNDIKIVHHDGPFKIMQRLLREYKRPNEHIISITLRTTGGIALKVINDNVRLMRYRNIYKEPTASDDVNCFTVSSRSTLMETIDNGTFNAIQGTVFAEIYGFAIQEFVTGVVTFPLKPVKGGHCISCKKNKMYYTNPIINCSKCGFTNRYIFKNKYDHIYFHAEAVQTHAINGEFIRYYDLKLHAKICRERLENYEIE